MECRIVSAQELFSRAKKMLDDGNTHVRIYFVEQDPCTAEAVGVEAWNFKETKIPTSYEPIVSIDSNDA